MNYSLQQLKFTSGLFFVKYYGKKSATLSFTADSFAIRVRFAYVVGHSKQKGRAVNSRPAIILLEYRRNSYTRQVNHVERCTRDMGV